MEKVVTLGKAVALGKAVTHLNRPDYALMRRCNAWLAPRWIRLWMLGASRCGDGWLWASIVALVLVGGGGSRWNAAFATVLSMLTSVAVFMVLKRVVNRRRPCEIQPHVWAELLPPDQFSFPSGHTMTAFAFTVALTRFYPSATAAMTFLAGSIAASRILLGMHFLSDVVVGALLGGAIGYAFALGFGG